MKLIVCLDNHNGMSFNHRRQSKDSKIIDDIVQMVGTESVYMDDYTKSMFKDYDQLAFCNSIEADTSYCFQELGQVPIEYVDTIIAYYWNRDYPFDKTFHIPISDWELVSDSEFKGSSHEKISKRLYKKKGEK